jgi:hypothetical protein
VIAAAGRTRGWFPVGGMVVDADRVRPAGTPGDDRLQELATRVGTMRVLYSESVEVANDGSDGRAAVVRVSGYDVSVPLLQSVVPGPRSNVTAVTEYRLEPYADSLEIFTEVTDRSGKDQQLHAGDVFVMADFLAWFAPPYGTDRDMLVQAGPLRYFGAFGGRVSYGYLAPGRKLVPLFPQTEVFAFRTDQIRLGAESRCSGEGTRRALPGGQGAQPPLDL